MLYWGFDLGDGESAIACTDGEGGLPAVVPVGGKKVTLTAWAVMKSGEVRIGEDAARVASAAMRSAARFKSRFLDPSSDCPGLIRDYASKLLEGLRREGSLKGGDAANVFNIGCPAGWSREDRERYRVIFENLGVPSPQVISESRAVLVGAIQSNFLRDSVDLNQKSVLVVDIGSSTTDFAYICKGREQEIRTGGEVVLGGGIMDELLLDACVERSPERDAIRAVFAASESWRVDCELHARTLKERYFSAEPDWWDSHQCRESLYISYDEPLFLDLFVDEDMARLLTEQPCKSLQGRSFREVFTAGLREVSRNIGEGQPELLFLTGGVSRMRQVADWCREVFQNAVIYTDSEPEFSVARGLAWCGKVDDELSHFRAEVDRLIGSSLVEDIVSQNLGELYESLLNSLLDPLLEHAVTPALLDWREGRIETLAELEPILQERIRVYLYSKEARELLFEPVNTWVRLVSEELERHTSTICRRYHVPDRSLAISTHLSADDFQTILGQIGANEVFPGEQLVGAAVFMESIISVLVGMICGGGGVVLVAEGPVGVVIGIVTSGLLFAAAHALGKKAVDQHIVQANLPVAIRRLALSRPLPRLEGASHSLTDMFRPQEEKENKGGFKLLPQLVFAGKDEISERRLRAIRSRVRETYRERMENPENTAFRELSGKLVSEVSDQIEQRLKTLAEQVEIPL